MCHGFRNPTAKHLFYGHSQRFAKIVQGALASVAQLVGHPPTKRKVTGLIPGQGTCLHGAPGPHLGLVQEATDGCFSPSLSPYLPRL